ncbi:MAG: hypothetical protein ABUR63_06475 [Verrucomicrobiota bacterium]
MLAVGAVALPDRLAWAVGLDDPHIGGIGFSGPTTGDLAAVYWNPAAVGLMHGLNLTFAGTSTQTTTTVARAPVAGLPSFNDTRASDFSQPFIWPPGPGSFAGVSYDVGGDRFTLAFATYMPFVDRSTYQATPGQALATRYHRVSTDLRNLALVPALSVRFLGDFRLGVAPGVLFSTGRLSFAESTCLSSAGCVEDPAADANLDLGSDQGIFSAKVGVTLAAGIYFRRRAWEFGFSFSSRPLGEVDGSAVISGDRSGITKPGGQPLTCQNGNPDGRNCVFADIVYKLPYTISGAVAWHPRPGWETAAIVRVLSFPANDVIDIRLTGTTLADASVPARISLYRGYGTVVDTRLRLSTWINQHLRAGVTLRFESSALPGRAVSPAAVDGRKVEPAAMIVLQVVRHVWIGAGYAFTYMFPVTANPSDFAPDAAARCTAAGESLTEPACITRRNGLARPTAAGTYHRIGHALSLSMTAQF